MQVITDGLSKFSKRMQNDCEQLRHEQRKSGLQERSILGYEAEIHFRCAGLILDFF